MTRAISHGTLTVMLLVIKQGDAHATIGFPNVEGNPSVNVPLTTLTAGERTALAAIMVKLRAEAATRVRSEHAARAQQLEDL